MGKKRIFDCRAIAVLALLVFVLNLVPLPLLLTLAADGLDIALSPSKGSEKGEFYVHILNQGTVDFSGSTVYLIVNGHVSSFSEGDPRVVVTPREILFYMPAYDVGTNPEQEAFIYVKNADGKCSPLRSFYYVNDPDIVSVNQNTQTRLIRDTSGTIISTEFEKQTIIIGDNFGLDASDSRQITQVTIGGYDAPIRERLDRTVIVKNPSAINEGQQYTVVVKNQVGGAGSMANVVVRPTPIIHNLSKFKVHQGNILDITGEAFTSGSVVKIDNTLITPTEITPNLIRLTIPDNLVPGTSKDVVVIDSTGQRATLVDELEVLPAYGDVQILSIFPNAGSVNGGTTVRIAGKGFQASMEVLFDGRPVTSKTIVDPSPSDPPGTTSVFRVVTPPAAPGKVGPVSVQIWDPNTESVITEDPVGFNYLLASETLVITDFVDADGNREGYDIGGENIYLHGKKFLWWISPSSTADRTITYPTREQTTTKMVQTTERATIPDPYIKDNPPNITVWVYRQITLDIGGKDAWISSITGPDDGEQLIAAETPRVNLDPPTKTNYSVNVTTRTIIKRENGEVIQDVVEQATAPAKYAYSPYPSAPEIDSITPARGPSVGGTTVKIIGVDFRTNVAVYFGDIKPQNRGVVTGLKLGPDQRGNKLVGEITVVTPGSSRRGKVDVHVVNPDGGSVTLVQGYEYHSSPTITNFWPAKGSTEGGTYVTITGAEFLAGTDDGAVGTTVYIGDVLADSVHIVSSSGVDITGQAGQLGTRVKVRIPPLPPPERYPAGKFKIRVVNADGGTAQSPDGMDFEFVDPPANPPLIGTITPAEGSIKGGTSVTITGGNFTRNILVTIDGEPLTEIIVQNNATITGKTPPGSRVGPVPVQVINLDTGGTATKEGGFRYHRIETNPKITGITPNHGTRGTKIIITGSDFVKGGLVDGQLLPSSVVYFGDTVVQTINNDPGDPLYVVSLNQIIVTVPDLGVPGLYEVKVKNPDTAEAVATVKFNYQVPRLLPTITSLTPTIGSVKGGTDVTIEGKDFEAGLEVYFGTNRATDVQLESLGTDPVDGRWIMRIRAKTPPGPAGPVNVTVVNPTGGSDTIPNAVVTQGFTYVVPLSNPEITDISPAQGSAAGYETVTIKGRDFRQQGTLNPTVTIGGQPAIVLNFVDDPLQGQTLTILTPPSTTAGPKDVTVTNPDAGTVTKKAGYTYTQSKITVTGIIPPKVSIAGGTVVTIIGNGFMRRTRVTDTVTIPATRVWIDGTELTGSVTIGGVTRERVEVISPTMMRVVTTAVNEAGRKELKLANPDNSAFVGQIEYVSPVVYPVITDIQPRAGTVDGGTLVTITGQNFRSEVEVYIGVTRAELVSCNETGTQLIIRTPAGNPADVGRKLDITVYNPEDGGSATWIECWEYKAHGVNPKITSVQPNEGSTLGGDLITIKGDNFRTGASVFIGTVAATDGLEVVDYQTIVVRTPAQPAGVYDIVVRNPDYGEATLAKGFTYKVTITEPTPEFNVRLSRDERGLKLTWAAVPGADQYELYGFHQHSYDSSPDEEDYKFITATANTYYYLTDLEEETYYYFRLRTLNKYGASSFVKATIYVDDPNSLNWPTRVSRDADQVMFRGDTLNITVGTDVLDDDHHYTHVIDLDEKKYASATTLQVNVPAEVVRSSRSYIAVRTPRYEVTFSPYIFYRHELREAEEDEQKVYGRLRLREADPREMERAALNLSWGERVVGSLDLSLELADGHKIIPLMGFNGTISVTLAYNSNVTGLPKGVYFYDPVTRTWADCRGYVNSFRKTASLEAREPGCYAVVYTVR